MFESEAIKHQPIHPKFEKYKISEYDKRALSYHFSSLRHPDYLKHIKKGNELIL